MHTLAAAWVLVFGLLVPLQMTGGGQGPDPVHRKQGWIVIALTAAVFIVSLVALCSTLRR
jgi:hypothetical protein